MTVFNAQRPAGAERHPHRRDDGLRFRRNVGDEAALTARVAIEALLIGREPARPVLAQQEGHPPAPGVENGVLERGLLTAADRIDLRGRRVPAAVDIDVATRPVVLVVQRP